jgi:hypothetical protein
MRPRATLAVFLACWCAPVLAQSPAERPSHRFDVSVGALWLGGSPLGSDQAQLRANRVQPAPFSLFGADTRIEPAAAFDGRIGFWLTRWLVVEGGLVYSKPSVRTRVFADAEGAEALTVAERLDQYFIDVSGVLLIDRLEVAGFVPYVTGGAGYLRQLHEGRLLVETGQLFHGGGGVRRWLTLRERGFIRAVGVRVDGRVYALVNGFEFDDEARPHGAISAAMFVTF